MDNKRVRFYWDYTLVFEWSDEVSDSQPHNIEDELPDGLGLRVRLWGKHMDEAFKLIHLEDAPPVDESTKDSLEREYLGIRERLQRLGYTMVAESRFPFDLPPATGPR